MFKKILIFSLSAIVTFLAISDTDAYFYAESFSFPPGNPYSTGNLTYFSWVVFKNVRIQEKWTIVFSTLTWWYGTTDTNLVTDLNQQLVLSVLSEVAILWNCNIVQYSSTTRVWTWLTCPWWRVFSWEINSLISVKWPKGEQWAPWWDWMNWLSAYDLAIANWFSWSEMEWITSLKWATGTTTHEIVFASWEIFSGATFSLGWQNGEFASGELYIPLTTNIDWTTYLNTDRMKQLIMQIIFFVIVGGAFWYFIIRKILWRQKEEHF